MCSREAAAGSSASIAASTSSLRARARAAIGTVRTSCATAHRFQVAARGNREARFDHVHAQRRQLPRHADLLRGIHGKARRLLAVAQGGVEDAYYVHRGPPLISNASGHAIVKFIFILHLIILPYTAFRGLNVDLGELHVFLTVANEGSFSRAAERLYRTQPAVSLAIRKLEDSLGQPLFVRGSRPVRLTDAGTLLKDYAERLLNLRDEVKKGLTELEGLKRGELSLGVNESSIHALLPALASFRERIPACRCACTACFRATFPHEVLNYRLDVGAVSFVPREPQLQATEILKDELALVVPPSIRSPSAKSTSPTWAAKLSSPTSSNRRFAAA